MRDRDLCPFLQEQRSWPFTSCLGSELDTLSPTESFVLSRLLEKSTLGPSNHKATTPSYLPLSLFISSVSAVPQSTFDMLKLLRFLISLCFYRDMISIAEILNLPI